MSNSTVQDESVSKLQQLDMDALTDLYNNVDPQFLSEYKPADIQYLMSHLPVRGVSFPDDSKLTEEQRMELRELAWSAIAYDGWNMSAEMPHLNKRKDRRIQEKEEEENDEEKLPDHNPILKRSHHEP